MELVIFWTQFAEEELYRIFNYYLKEDGYKTAKRLVDNIYEETFKLTRQLRIGQAEEYLLNRKTFNYSFIAKIKLQSFYLKDF